MVQSESGRTGRGAQCSVVCHESKVFDFLAASSITAEENTKPANTFDNTPSHEGGHETGEHKENQKVVTGVDTVTLSLMDSWLFQSLKFGLKLFSNLFLDEDAEVREE